MELTQLQTDKILHELEFRTSRSSGPGGQHVNKTNSKVELRFSIANSLVLTPEQKEILLKKWQHQLTTEGELILTNQSSRSQLSNKEMVIQNFFKLITKALKPKIKRIATKPTGSSVLKRLEDKKMQSQKKSSRKDPME